MLTFIATYIIVYIFILTNLLNIDADIDIAIFR